MKRIILGLSFAIASLHASAPARAEVSPTAQHASAAFLLGYGFREEVGFGLGARGGYTLPMNVYVGGTLLYHFGGSKAVPGAAEASFSLFYIGVEGGYDVAAGPVIVRPYLGLGPAVAHGSSSSCVTPGTCASASYTDTRFGVWPGGTVLYPIDNVFVGGDARVLLVSGFVTFAIFATGGMQF